MIRPNTDQLRRGFEDRQFLAPTATHEPSIQRAAAQAARRRRFRALGFGVHFHQGITSWLARLHCGIGARYSAFGLFFGTLAEISSSSVRYVAGLPPRSEPKWVRSTISAAQRIMASQSPFTSPRKGKVQPGEDQVQLATVPLSAEV